MYNLSMKTKLLTIYIIFSFFLTGCVTTYYGGGSDEKFYTDSAECEAMGAQSDNAIVSQRITHRCMQGRGWKEENSDEGTSSYNSYYTEEELAVDPDKIETLSNEEILKEYDLD